MSKRGAILKTGGLCFSLILAASALGGFAGYGFAHEVNEGVDISITDEGFSPDRVRVHRGTTVTWTNNGQKPHWPASDVHPTHTVYPEKSEDDCLGSSFDACRGLLPGEVYSFTFAEVGSWRFHDHLNASLVGVVEVIEDEEGAMEESFLSRVFSALLAPIEKMRAWWSERFRTPGEEYGLRKLERGESMEEYIREQMSLCWKEGGKGRCYEAVAALLMKKHDLGEVMQAMGRAEQYPEVHNRCHEVTHFLAREGYKRNGSVRESYGMCTEACWGGCYHGTMEQHFFEKDFSLSGEDDEKIQKEMTSICGAKEDYVEPGRFYECLHGLGHAMMFITGADLPKSLRYCDLLGEERYARACYGGVFMENSSSSTNRDHPSEWLDPDDPLYPCTVLDEKYLPTCYQYQSSHFSTLARYDWKKVSDMCETVPAPYQGECFNMIGSNQVGYTQEYAVMRENCALVPEKFFTECIQGAVGSIGVRFMEEPTRMLDFCSEAPSRVQEACYLRVGQVEMSLRESEESLRSLCGEIQIEDRKSACLEPISR